MADERTYFVLCADNCKFEGMTKEQILTAIEQAISTGEIKDVDTGFVTKIKERNNGAALSFWVGTTAQYNALEKKSANCFYILTDDTMTEDINQTIASFEKSLESFGNIVNEHSEKFARNGVVLFDWWANGEEYLSVGTELPALNDYQMVFVKLSAGGQVLCSVFNDTLNNKIKIRGVEGEPTISGSSGYVNQYNVVIEINAETSQVTKVEATRLTFYLQNNTGTSEVAGINYASHDVTKIFGIM